MSLKIFPNRKLIWPLCLFTFALLALASVEAVDLVLILGLFRMDVSWTCIHSGLEKWSQAQKFLQCLEVQKLGLSFSPGRACTLQSISPFCPSFACFSSWPVCCSCSWYIFDSLI